MEGYGIFQDGFVLDLEVVKFDSSPAYVAVKCKVKPRTKDKDSVTALPYYGRLDCLHQSPVWQWSGVVGLLCILHVQRRVGKLSFLAKCN